MPRAVKIAYALLALALLGVASNGAHRAEPSRRSEILGKDEPHVVHTAAVVPAHSKCAAIAPRVAGALKTTASRIEGPATSSAAVHQIDGGDCKRGLVTCSGRTTVAVQPLCAGARTFTADELSRVAAVVSDRPADTVRPFMQRCLDAMRGRGTPPADIRTGRADVVCDITPGWKPIVRIEVDAGE